MHNQKNICLGFEADKVDDAIILTRTAFARDMEDIAFNTDETLIYPVSKDEIKRPF